MLKTIAFSAAALLPLAQSNANTLIGDGHIDLNLGYSAETGFQATGNYTGPSFPDTVYSLNAAVFHLDEDAQIVSPGDSLVGSGFGDFSILGPQGSDAWLIDQTQQPSVPWLGFSGYGIGGSHNGATNDLAIFDGASIEISFLGFEGPAGAMFGMWNYGVFGGLNPVFSSHHDVMMASDSFILNNGQHVHYAWGFSEPGEYTINLAVNGTINGIAVPTGTFDVHFLVGDAPPAVPEPRTTAMLLGVSALGFAVYRSRRAR
ncbi:MAG: choice-of-anchor M domain-containing protein [Verrucomicrobiota bacterium JB022]|nr:choice-of-anchor M domain-containing protein [Verrucomicrobiota bacterium JB022]